MDITMPLLILVIPLAMFLILGIGGVKMSHKLAATLGICGMGTCMVLSYITALTYYFSGNPDFQTVPGQLQLLFKVVIWFVYG